MLSKLLDKIKSYQYHIFLAICIGLISFISFNLGKIASNDKGEIKVTEKVPILPALQEQNRGSSISQPNLEANLREIGTSIHKTPKPLDMRVVASKKSKTRLYHFVWCPGAKQIKEENKLWFNNEQEAVQTGYKLAGNCTR